MLRLTRRLGHPVAFAAGLVAVALVAAGLAVALAWRGGPSRPVYDVPPGWTVRPAAAGTPAGFCATLTAELGHLRQGSAARSRRAVEADWSGFFHSLPALVPAAPGALRPEVRTYVAVTTDFYEALLQRSFGGAAGPARLAGEVRSVSAARAVAAVVRFASAHCHPDPVG